MRKTRLAIICSLMLLAALGAVGTVAVAAPGKGSAELRKAVTTERIMQHERQLQRIAAANGNNRASGTQGYNDSAQYVAQRLRAAGYKVNLQPFDFFLFEETAPPQMERLQPTLRLYVEGQDFATMSYSGSGTANAPVQPVDVRIPPGDTPSGNTSGCEDADFAGFTSGNIALVQRGTCTFGEKALNAQEAGASAVIIFNEGQPGRDGVLQGTLGATDAFEIPVVGASYEVGQELYDLDQGEGDAVVEITTNTSVEKRTTRNVIGRTPGGASGRAVVVGAHLDSVDEGPGINDNGSGTASTLEIAEQMSRLDIEPRNQVRFAFWGAEESGLIGSTHYVNQLSEEGLGNIMVNLNFDMLGSPNFVRFVYDGDGSDEPSTGPDGSGRVEKVFNNYFASRGLETEPTAFDGRSDYKPFIDNGIPGGGLFSGAEGIKSAEEAAIYGGVAGAPYDPCYHQACDDIQNLNATALSQLSDGAAHATYAFAMTPRPVTDGTAQVQSQRTSAEPSTYLGKDLQK